MGDVLDKTVGLTLDSQPPETLPGLLRALHIEALSALQQQRELKVWFGTHAPSPHLRLSLRSNGFGLLLKDLNKIEADGVGR